MKQTLLALLALTTATFMNYSQMQSDLRSQRRVVRAELKNMAIGVAMQTLEVIRARKFDAKVIEVPKSEITSPTQFTDADFTTGNRCQAFFDDGVTCNDIDDFHKMETATIPFKTPEFEVQFSVDVEVQYVNDSMEPVDQPTYRKEVIIKVQDKRETPYFHEPIRFSEVMTFY